MADEVEQAFLQRRLSRSSQVLILVSTQRPMLGMLKALRDCVVKDKVSVNNVEEIMGRSVWCSVGSQSHDLSSFKYITKDLESHRRVHPAQASKPRHSDPVRPHPCAVFD